MNHAAHLWAGVLRSVEVCRLMDGNGRSSLGELIVTSYWAPAGEGRRLADGVGGSARGIGPALAELARVVLPVLPVIDRTRPSERV